MIETYISTVHSESGRRTGVVIISDDAKFIRDSKRLTDTIKSVWRGDGMNADGNKKDAHYLRASR